MAKKNSSVRNKGTTPLMRQYRSIKERNPGTLLLFRMGDFYETFEEDARIAHDVLGITLTRRSNGQATDVALAGFPHHALDTYLPRLVRAGLRVAICEQLEDPRQTRTIVKRDVVEVVTPGVSFRDQLLDPRRSCYLASVYWPAGKQDRGKVGVSFADISTGEFSVTEVDRGELSSMLQTIGPAEVLVEKSQRDRLAALHESSFIITTLDDWAVALDFANELLTRHFGTHSLKGFGIEEMPLGIVAAGAVLHYLRETQPGRVNHVRSISRYDQGDFMLLDPQTRRNLEILAPLNADSPDGTLVRLLDDTCTPMGARRLRHWLLRPLRRVEDIDARLDAVSCMFEDTAQREAVRQELRSIDDLERIAARISASRATPRDLIALRDSLQRLPAVKELLPENPDSLLGRTRAALEPCDDLAQLISEAIVDDPPLSLNKGGVIRDGYDAELDAIRSISRSGKDWLTQLQQKESERTGIPSLKIGFNKVFGYYIEITHTHRDRVPEEYIRKQTLVNAERYITPDLKDYEEKILDAEEKIVGLESELFESVCSTLAKKTDRLLQNAVLISRIDVLASFAETAVRNRYIRPIVNNSDRLDIRAGRHPVVEQMLPVGEPFIPNDVTVDPAEDQIMILTGPNMAGKSVLLRQVGLITLLAQVGSFVPADTATVGVTDRIFTRVGASDNLAAGESTFLVEMNETANILNSASRHSLILLDEVGRGTSTFDGLSIAWALVEFLHDHDSIAARTLFATHYHELNELSLRLERVRNYRVMVQEHEGRIVFLRKIVPGGADHSYGIEVARMAGLPDALLLRARDILQHLETQRLEVEEVLDEAGVARRKLSIPPSHSAQMSLFNDQMDPVASRIRERVEAMDPEKLTPIDALVALNELKKMTHEDT